ncbi:MAG: hypothetical protein ACYC06_07905 [Ilumatobacteraceae bacterium]
MARSSSAEKVARLAEKGRGKKVRFQGGTLFPTVVALVCILGVALIAYARQSNAGSTTSTSIDTTYYSSFGVYKCDAYVTGFPSIGLANTDPAQLQVGATIVQDGIISWKPQVLAGERRAKLSTFFDLFGITVTDDSVTFPTAVNGGEKITESNTKCGGKDAQLEVIVWDDYTKLDSSKISVASLGGVRLTGNGMAIALAFVAKDAEVPQPDSTLNLASLLTNP